MLQLSHSLWTGVIVTAIIKVTLYFNILVLLKYHIALKFHRYTITSVQVSHALQLYR